MIALASIKVLVVLVSFAIFFSLALVMFGLGLIDQHRARQRRDGF